MVNIHKKREKAYKGEILMRWVHFSDIHFNFDGYDTSQMRTKLLEYLVKKKFEKIDALFITGDFRFAPQKEFIEDTKKFIEDIRSRCGIDEKSFCYTVGNHDVSRSESRKSVVTTVRQSYKSCHGNISKEMWEMLRIGFKEFNNFIKDSNGEIVGEENPHRFIENENVNIISMNTAITSAEKSNIEYGQLIIGIKFLRECFEKIDKNKPTIVCGHHSIESLSYEERIRVIELFQNYGVHIYLCGHNHKFNVNNISDDEKYKIYEIFSGNLYTEENVSQCGFLIGTLENDVLEMECHEWDFNNRKWHISNTYSDDEKSDKKTLNLTENRLMFCSNNVSNWKTSSLQRIMQFNNRNVAITVPEYQKKFKTRSWPVIHKSEYEYTLKLISAMGIADLNIETECKPSYAYSEIHIGGPTVNPLTYRYLNNYISSYRSIVQKSNIPNKKYVDPNFTIVSEKTGFSVVDKNNERIVFCRIDNKSDIGILIRIKVNEKKTVHLLFGTGKRGTIVAINCLINYAEEIEKKCGEENYCFCIWGNYLDCSIDTSKELHDLSYLLEKK